MTQKAQSVTVPAVLGQKGRIVIPAFIRKALELNVNDPIWITVENGAFIVTKKDDVNPAESSSSIQSNSKENDSK